MVRVRDYERVKGSIKPLFLYVVFTCGSLDNPPNGEVMTTGFEVGDTATYICFEGYSVEGEDVRECQSNGEWSGVPPFCIGELPCT